MRSQTLDEVSASDRDAVRAVVEASGTSFYWAMRLLPQDKRDGLFAVYAFCRLVDDIADGTLPAAAKHAALDAWRQRLSRLYQGETHDALDRVLTVALHRHNLGRAHFDAVIDGMAMDADGPIVAPERATLDLYCDRVASAVGRLCVPIFGEPGENGMAVAHHLGRALQLTNILRDVHEDAAIGRLYLPVEDLAEAGISAREPLAVAAHPRLPQACATIGARARDAFRAADEALARCDPAAMRPARIMRDVYRWTLDELEAGGWHPPPTDPGQWQRLRRKLIKLAIALSGSLR